MQEEKTIQIQVDSYQAFKDAQEGRVLLKMGEKQYYLESEAHNEANQNISLRLFMLPSVFMTLIFYLFFNWRDQSYIPLSGRISTASITIVLGTLSSLITFALYFVSRKKKGAENLQAIKWRNFPTILITFGIVTAMALVFAFWIFGRLFSGLVLDIYLSSLLAFLFLAIINYVMIYYILILSPSLMIRVLNLVIMMGVLISMITNSEAQWWQDNISFLGTSDAANAWQFNLTLMLSAFLLVALLDYLFLELKDKFPKHKGLNVLQVLLLVMSISLGLVGFFPADGRGNSPAYHNQAAGMLVIAVLLMIIGIKWLMPKITKEFLLTSYGVGLLLVLVTYFYLNGTLFSLTGFEIVAFFLAFSWLMLLFQSLEKLTHAEIVSYNVTVKYQQD